MFIASAALCIIRPDSFLPALIEGAGRAVTSFASLFCVYALWMGLSKVCEDANITAWLANKLAPLTGRIFRTKNKSGAQYASMNVCCNMIGLGGAATPYGIKAMKEFDGDGNLYGRNLLFILNATSVQIFPATVIGLRAAGGSASAADIFLPALITTAICTGLAVALYILANKLWRL